MRLLKARCTCKEGDGEARPDDSLLRVARDWQSSRDASRHPPHVLARWLVRELKSTANTTCAPRPYAQDENDGHAGVFGHDASASSDRKGTLGQLCTVAPRQQSGCKRICSMHAHCAKARRVTTLVWSSTKRTPIRSSMPGNLVTMVWRCDHTCRLKTRRPLWLAQTPPSLLLRLCDHCCDRSQRC